MYFDLGYGVFENTVEAVDAAVPAYSFTEKRAFMYGFASGAALGIVIEGDADNEAGDYDREDFLVSLAMGAYFGVVGGGSMYTSEKVAEYAGIPLGAEIGAGEATAYAAGTAFGTLLGTSAVGGWRWVNDLLTSE